MAFPKGSMVRQIVKPIIGTVARFDVDQTTGEVLVLVEWADESGNPQSKYFRQDELEANDVAAG